MISKFSETLGKLYDAAFDTNKWKPFLADLTEIFESDAAHLLAAEWNDEQVFLSVYHGVSDTMLQAYSEFMFDEENDPRPAYVRLHPGKPFHWGMLPNVDEFLKSRVYLELFEPHGCHDQLLVGIPVEKNLSPARHLGLGVWRDRSRGVYSEKDCDLLSEFVPHIRRVFELQRQFVSGQFVDNPAIDVLKTLPIGVLLCDTGAHVHFANDIARRITGRGDGLTEEHGALWAGQTAVTELLRDHIHRAVEAFGSSDPELPATISIERSADQSPLLVMIGAVSKDASGLQSNLFRQPLAVVYVSDPDIQQETSEDLLQRLFGLTNAEAELLKRIVGGSSLKLAAKRCSITEGTARSYLKQIFAKTNTTGQADLVRHVLSSPAWLRHSRAEPLDQPALYRTR